MYKSLTKQDWEKILVLPKDYQIDALIVAAVGKRKRNIKIFDEYITREYKATKANNVQDEFFRGVQEYKVNGKTIWFDIVYGGAYLSELTHIASLFGSKKNFLVGTCGGLQKGLKPGDIVVPTYTYGDESTTRMYQRENTDSRHFSNEKLSLEVCKAIEEKYPVTKGPMVTCEAMLAETQEDVDQWQKEGYIGVEMETSTYFAISNHFNIPSTAILHISDNLVDNILIGDDRHSATKEYREEIKLYKYKVIIENIINN